MSKSTVITLVVIVFVLLVVGYFTYSIRNQHERETTDSALLFSGTTTPYTTFAGDPIELEQPEGEVRVVTSWASWSPLSKEDLPKLNQLAKAYAEQNIKVIAINRNENVQHAQKFIDHIGPLPYIQFIADTEDEFFARVDGRTVPETLFFNANGDLIEHVQGQMRYNEMQRLVDEALEK